MSRRKVLCTIGAGPHARLLDLSRPTRERFAQRHGYELLERTELLDPSRPASWSKVVLLQQLLEEGASALWVDADSVFVDDRSDPLAALSRRRWIGVVAHRYDGQVVPNLGVIALRPTRGARRLLREMWRMSEYVDHKWWENAAFLDLLGYDISSEPIHLVERRRLAAHVADLDLSFNSIPHVCRAPDPVINHYAACSQEEREQRIAADVEEAMFRLAGTGDGSVDGIGEPGIDRPRR